MFSRMTIPFHFTARYIFLSFAVFLLSQCGSPDYYQDLSGKYLFYGGDGDGILATMPGKKNIYGKVTKIGFDENFILARQEPDYRDYQNKISFELGLDSSKYSENSSADMRYTDRMADSLLKNDPIYKKIFSSKVNFWIISHRSGRVFGPLTKKEFDSQRSQLKVPTDLQLEDI